MQQFVTKAVVAAALDVDARTVSRYQGQSTDPLPVAVVGKRGTPHQYDIGAVVKWAIRQKLDELQAGQNGQVIDFNKERARLTQQQADKVTLENAQLRATLLPIEMVVSTWSEMIANARARLLGLPTKIAPAVTDCEDIAENRAILTEAISEALQELADDGLPPSVRDIAKSVSDSDEGLDAAAEING